MSEKIKHTEGPFRVPAANLFRVVKPIPDPRSKDHPWIPLAEMLEHETISGEEMAENAILFAAAPQMEKDIAALREREKQLEKLLREARRELDLCAVDCLTRGIEMEVKSCATCDEKDCSVRPVLTAIDAELGERP